MPSLWMVPPSGGITPLPSQQHILDFSPLMKAMAETKPASSTGSKGSKNEMPDIGMDMRLGYTRQLWDKYIEQSDQLSTLEKIYTPEIAQQLPEYQAIQKDRDQNTVGQYALTAGKREQEKYSGYDKYVQSNKASTLFNLDAWYAGQGLKKNEQHLGILEQATSRNFDPNTPNAGWVEDFPTAPSVATLETARVAADGLFNPAFSARETKTSWANHIGDYVVGQTMGIMKQSGGSSDNFAALEAASNQAKERIFSGNDLDISDDLTAGYLQGFVKKTKQKGKGFFLDDKLMFDEDRNWTKSGAEAFHDFVVNDLVGGHEKKRKDPRFEYDESYQEQSETAYSLGAAAKELAEITAPTQYREGEVYLEQSVLEFDNIMYANMTNTDKATAVLAGDVSLTPQQQKDIQSDLEKRFGAGTASTLMANYLSGNATEEDRDTFAKSYGVVMGNQPIQLTEKGKMKRDILQKQFDEVFATDKLDAYGNVVVPALFTTTGDLGAGKYYTPKSTEEMNYYMQDVGRDIQKDYDPKTGQWKTPDAEAKFKLFQKVQGDLAIKTAQAQKSLITVSKTGTQHLRDVGSTPELNKAVGQSIPVGTVIGNSLGTTIWFGANAYNAAGLSNSIVLDNGEHAGSSLEMDAGGQNFGVATVTEKNVRMYGIDPKTGINATGDMRIGDDGKTIFQKNRNKQWVPFYTFTDQFGNAENYGMSAPAENGYMRPPMTETQAKALEEQSVSAAFWGNTQSHLYSPAKWRKPITLGAPGGDQGLVEEMSKLQFRREVYGVDPQVAERAFNKAPDALKKVQRSGESSAGGGLGSVRNLKTTSTYTVDPTQLPAGVTAEDVSAVMKQHKFNEVNPSYSELKYAIGSAIEQKTRGSVPHTMAKVIIHANAVQDPSKTGIAALHPDAIKTYDVQENKMYFESDGKTKLKDIRWVYKGMRDATGEIAHIIDNAKGQATKINANHIRDAHGVINGPLVQNPYADPNQPTSPTNSGINLLNPIKSK